MDRDIYERERRLRYWLEKVDNNNVCTDEDKEDIKRYIQYHIEKETSLLRVALCIQVLTTLRAFLSRPFRYCTKEDIRNLITALSRRGYNAETESTYRTILKHFFKVCYGNNEYYPEQVAWLKTKVSKDKRRESEGLDLDSFLTEEEVKRLVDTADTLQRKAMIATAYETGARPEELLNLRIRDIAFDQYGCTVILRGKTGERRVRMIAYAPLLREWINIHPFRKNRDSYVWLSEATNHKWKPLKIFGAEAMFRNVMRKAGIDKDFRLYVLRHSRATHLAGKLTEAEMCKFFGWVLGTQVVKRYIHLAGIDIDSKLLQLQGLSVEEDKQGLKVKRCIRCQELLSPNHDYCPKCGLTREVESILLAGKGEEEEEEKNKKVERLEAEVAKLTALVEELLKRKALL